MKYASVGQNYFAVCVLQNRRCSCLIWQHGDMTFHGALAIYVKLQIAHAPGMPGTFIAIPTCAIFSPMIMIVMMCSKWLISPMGLGDYVLCCHFVYVALSQVTIIRILLCYVMLCIITWLLCFFPAFDRFIPGFDRFIPGFDRFIPE